mmetsp:Transcript_30886/g.72802  ORF Transcript_30886/g.72802 Transcript_30886/m.72802 type:complete len:487 (-) Transcript_30886:251-1711(-)
MSTIPANSSGTCSFGNGSNDLNAKNTPSSDANGTGGAMSRASISSMMVQDFMAYLANEPNIANMTVETNDGRRISATFEHGTVETVAPSNSLNMSKTTCNGVSKNISWNGSPDEKNDKANGNSKNDELMSQTSQTRDVAATMAMMGEEKLASASKMQAPTSEGYDSQQWAINYSNKHVAITYSNIGAAEISSIPIENVPKTSGSSTLPPKKRAAKQEEGTSETSWNPMAALADAATVLREHAGGPQVIPTIAGTQVASAIAMGATVATEALKKKPPRRKSRKIIPEVKVYVEFTQKDVLFGRGGRSNHHPGNKIYRDIVTKEQKHYRGCDKNEKTKVAQCIVDHIQGVVGGRFLEMDRDVKRWFLVPNVVARRKVGQALRENNTEEARAAKRAKYQGKLNNKKKNLATIDGENDVVYATAVNSANAGNSTLPFVPANSANTTIASIPVVGVSGSTNNVVYPIAAVTGVTANNFPVDDPESSNQVEV